jgi:hypothetical protein
LACTSLACTHDPTPPEKGTAGDLASGGSMIIGGLVEIAFGINEG